MFIIDNVIVPRELSASMFSCRLKTCRGACCIVGDAGAPIQREEIVRIERRLPDILPVLTGKSRKYIERFGFARLDELNHWSVSCLDGTGRCVFVKMKNGIARCALERIDQTAGQGSLRPVSCKLFPLRVRRWGSFYIIDPERWEECESAWRSRTPLVEFCLEGLEIQFGRDWVERFMETIGRPAGSRENSFR
ncbi:DUF3109 family protein [bacterium]|nr:DUF3109 family protein [candidate division CSSED10-310 bacterium]